MRHCLAVAVLVLLSGTSPVVAGGPEPPPPTPVPPAGSPSPFPTVLQTPEDPTTRPRPSAESVALVDAETGELLFGRAAGERRPIASLTKIMTALLVLEEASLDDVVTVGARAVGEQGASLDLEPGEEIVVRDLLFALMLQSSNDAAIALAEHVAGSVEAFVGRMNRRADELGLADTRFSSPNGLDDSGFSTARDLATLVAAAFEEPLFGRIVTTRFYEVPAPMGPPRRLQNRNVLLWLYPGAIGVKTGFTSAAGFSVVGAARREDLPLVAVVLGAPDEAFSEAATLLEFGFASFERRTLAEAGEPVGLVPVDGLPVPASVKAPLLVTARRDASVRIDLAPRRDLALPVAAGDRIGTAVARAGDEPLARAPALASRAVRRPRIEPARWLREIEDLAGSLARLVLGLLS